MVPSHHRMEESAHMSLGCIERTQKSAERIICARHVWDDLRGHRNTDGRPDFREGYEKPASRDKEHVRESHENCFPGVFKTPCFLWLQNLNSILKP